VSQCRRHILALPTGPSIRAGISASSGLVSLQVVVHCLHANQLSADLEMTVNMLIQIDKLVQLIESPVFTCMFLKPSQCSSDVAHRPANAAPRARKISAPLQVPIRPPDASPTVLCVCCPQESLEQRLRNRIPPHSAPNVRALLQL